MASTVALAPTTAADVAAALHDAATRGDRLDPVGRGTRTMPGDRREGTTELSTCGLQVGLTHIAGDLVATVPAGMTLHAVNEALAGADQWLPLDPPSGAHGTIGGILAANDSGPRRHRFGTPRDLVIGTEIALVSGEVVQVGGRVVKNVAGYDLSRLMCGARGSLGVITQATFKLMPRTSTSRTVIAEFPNVAAAVAGALRIDASTTTPSTIELSWETSPHLLLRFESTEQSVAAMSSAAARELAAAGATTTTVAGAAEAEVWTRHTAAADDTAGTRLAVSTLPTSSGRLLTELHEWAAPHGTQLRVVGRAARGLFHLQVVGPEGAQADVAARVRATVAAMRGTGRLCHAPDSVAAHVGVWDTPGPTMAVARAIKQQFDPTGVLPWPWDGGARG